MSSLSFDATQYQEKTVRVDGQEIAVRAFENIVYVANPVDTTWQVMNIYVPEAYFSGGTVGGHSAETAPIFFPNQVGGYMPGKPGTLDGDAGGPPPGGAPTGSSAGKTGSTAAGTGTTAASAGAGTAASAAPAQNTRPRRSNTIARALARGHVVASAGARGRTTQDASGHHTGKAPAAIVDLKAAVRWLHHNDAAMPGRADRIISNGTSAGGALSALLGASGNHADYANALKALGAADAPDAIFAVSAYCPITNLEHADSAYEWMFNGFNDYRKIDISMLDYQVQRKEVKGTLDATQIRTSDALKPLFPPYVNSLKLRDAQGRPLTLDDKGNGSFRDHVKSLVVASAQKALDEGAKLSQHGWLTIRDGKVTDLDWKRFVQYAGRMKVPPAFDGLDLGTGENQLFGTATVDKQHFTDFSQQRSTVEGARRADAQAVKMMNAMQYLGASGATQARHWRIRHGTIDRDTSLAIPVILGTTLQNQGHDVDLALPWDRPHSGDYDLDELFAWIDRISR